MEYDLYHDESQEEGYWHGMLLVSRPTRDTFLEYLNLIRNETGYHHPVTLKKLNTKGFRFNCIRAWIQLSAGALMQYFKNEPFPVLVGRRKYSVEERKPYASYKKLLRIDSNDKIIGAKFILFKERDSHSKMGDLYPDFASKIETTFGFGLKGGMHWLGTEKTPIRIRSIHFDGHKHYGRNIDQERIMKRISGLRDYCSFEDEIKINDKTGKHNVEDCQHYDDCQFLQLTDLLVGSFRTILGSAKNSIQKEVAHPIKELIGKWQDGLARMKNSRWFEGFWMSECWLDGDRWSFEDFRSIDKKQPKLL